MGLLTKIFGNRDDQEAALGEGSDSPERETIEIEPLTDEPLATPEQTGQLAVADAASPAGDDAGSPAGDDPSRRAPVEAEVAAGARGAAASRDGAASGGGRRKQRRGSRTGSNGGRQQQKEVTRGRIARPTVSTFDAPGAQLPIPLDASRALPSSPRNILPGAARDITPGAARAGGPSAARTVALGAARGGSTPGAPSSGATAASSSAGSSSAASSSAVRASATPPATGRRGAAAADAAGGAARSGAGSSWPEAEDTDDPDEIDVSDQLDEVTDDEGADGDLDASEHLIIEDDAPNRDGSSASREPYGSEDDDDEETNTSVAIWGTAASSPTASSPTASSPTASSVTASSPIAPSPAASPERTSAKPISPADPQFDPEWTRMAVDTKTKQTLVEAGTEFTGTLKSSCPVVVNGKLEGEVDAPTLSIARTGAILGTIRAQTLRSFGTLAGSVEAGEVYVSGAVRSKTVIKTRRLEVKIGSSEQGSLEVTFGNCDLELSDAPSSPEASLAFGGPSEGESTGSSGWDLPEADSRVMPARAGIGGERARSK